MTGLNFSYSLAAIAVIFISVSPAAADLRAASETKIHHQAKLWTDLFARPDAGETHRSGRAAKYDGARRFSGRASYYWQGKRVASGGRFDPRGFTCAHRTLPFGTRVRVTDPKSQRSVVVTVNDRGPFTGGRVLDLSLGAAQALGMTARGVINVVAEII